jgi:succinate dehydrogenase/fumarate reductase flavoprotein subunit
MIEAPVYAKLDMAEPALQDWLRQGQPNCFTPYDRMGIDPFKDLFRVTFKAEGTVRGTGGIRIATSDCGTDVVGLYVAGDAASRENLTGGVSGGGGPNSSWAIASGWWSGQGAAAHAKRHEGKAFRGTSRPLGQAGLRPASSVKEGFGAKAVVETVQAEVIPLDKNYFRDGSRLQASRGRLDNLWSDVRDHLSGEGNDRLRAREAASIVAAGRWSVTAALARKESRGMHRRTDIKSSDPAFARRLVLSGVDTIEIGGDADQDRKEMAS